MEKFNELAPGEAVVLSFNFVLFLTPLGARLTGTPVLTFVNIYGGDPNSIGMINGPPAIDTTGLRVLQPVIGAMDMNDYVVTAKCLTTNQYWTPVLPALLPVRLYPSRVGAP